MFSSDCLDLPGLWNKKLGVLESPGSLFTCVAPLTIRPRVGAVSGTDFGNGWKRGFSDERARFLIGAFIAESRFQSVRAWKRALP